MRRLMTLLALGVAVPGCGLFIHGATPIGSVPKSDREVLAQGVKEPNRIRLLQPATVAGFELAPGSIVERRNTITYAITSANSLVVSGVPLPAGSKIELEKTNSIITGDHYNWTGVAFSGAETTFSGQPVETGDRLYFAGKNIFGAPPLAQLRIARPREVKGKMYPAGTLFDLEEDGTISGAYTPDMQRSLSAARAQAKKDREQREKDCKLRCAPVTDFTENARCLGNCRSS
jgi:hypothetical protein